MDFINCRCVKCGVVITKDDEVAVCHICGSPHHCTCFSKGEECANAHKHSETFAYKKDGRRKYPGDEQAQNTLRPCLQCGYINKTEQNNCVRCGADFNNKNQTQTQGPFAGMPFLFRNPLSGTNMREKVDDVTLGEMSVVVMTNLPRYLPKFSRMSKEKRKISWNWAAFFLGGYWFLYRKMYLAGVVALTLIFALGLLQTPANTIFSNIWAGIFSQNVANNESMAEIIRTFREDGMILVAFAFGIIAVITTRIFMGLFGDHIYKQSVVRRAKILREVDRNEKPFGFFKNPIGVSLFAPMIGFFALRYLSLFVAAL